MSDSHPEIKKIIKAIMWEKKDMKYTRKERKKIFYKARYVDKA